MWKNNEEDGKEAEFCSYDAVHEASTGCSEET